MLDALVLLAFVAIDDLRDALTAVLVNADVYVLVALIALVYFANKNQGKIAGSLNFENPLKKLRLF